MELQDVTNFALLEEYINKRERLTSFEDTILQEVVCDFREPELFFLVRDPNFTKDLSWLMKTYQREIEGKYSSHQLARMAKLNGNSSFFAKIYQSVGWHSVYDPLFDKKYYQYAECFRESCLPFEQAFREEKDYEVLYEDELVKIIVFLLRVQRISYSVDENSIVMEQNGYYVDPNISHLILPYDSPYCYKYFYYPDFELRQELSEQEYHCLKLYYEEQGQLLKRKLERK